MNHFTKIKEALEYIDHNLAESLTLESIADYVHFSPWYFHRLFSLVAGRAPAAYIRQRRLMRACALLSETDKTVLDIGIECGFGSAPSFSRAFKRAYGLSPGEYRRQGIAPNLISVDEIIMKFTNRLKGGVFVNPQIIKREKLIVAGVSGDGGRTGEVWQSFEKLHERKPLENRRSGNGYEVRLYDGDNCTVHVGFAVSSEEVPAPYETLALPASKYAAFDVYVANGYDSENNAMDEWLRDHREEYSERLLGQIHYCVEYYDERFTGDEAGSIVEIWIPIEKK